MSATIATAQTYEPEAGSVPARVLDLFIRMPDEEFTSGDLALKYVVRAEKFSALLAGAISCGLLRYERTTGSDGGKVWRAGPHLKAWADSRGSAAVAVAAASSRGLAQPARPRRPLKPASAAIDLAAAPVLKQLPIPEAVRGGVNGSRYAAMWDRLGVGDAFELPAQQVAGLAAYCRKNRRSFTVRTTGDGIKTIWRTA
jgi:hypothetical protein